MRPISLHNMVKKLDWKRFVRHLNKGKILGSYMEVTERKGRGEGGRGSTEIYTRASAKKKSFHKT